MTIEMILLKEGTAAYFVSPEILIRSEQDALDLMGEAQSDAIILHAYNFEDSFFDLSTRTLGNVLQKFTNYRVRLAVIGDFSKYPSKVFPAFQQESNRQGQYLFVSSLDDVLQRWK